LDKAEGGRKVIDCVVVLAVLLLNIYAIDSCIHDNDRAFAISKVLADGIALIYVCTH